MGEWIDRSSGVLEVRCDDGTVKEINFDDENISVCNPYKNLFKKIVKSIIVNEIYYVKMWFTAWIFLNMPIRTE